MQTTVIPQTNYVLDPQGHKIFVQIPIKDWENFVHEFKALEAQLYFKDKLKNAFREVRQIQKGYKTGTPLNDFLNEL
jgi:hypothetical protein